MLDFLKNPVLIDTAETVLVGLAIFVLIYIFIVQPNRVDGESMSPAFHTNDYILTEKVSYRLRTPKRGEIVVANSPTDQSQQKELIKRVIALPGEKITIGTEGIIIMNADHPDGYKLIEPYLPDSIVTNPDVSIRANTPYQLADDEFIVMGDNRSHSADSRYFGAVKRTAIVGRAVVRYWPLSKLSLFPGTLQ